MSKTNVNTHQAPSVHILILTDLKHIQRERGEKWEEIWTERKPCVCVCLCLCVFWGPEKNKKLLRRLKKKASFKLCKIFDHFCSDVGKRKSCMHTHTHTHTHTRTHTHTCAQTQMFNLPPEEKGWGRLARHPAGAKQHSSGASLDACQQCYYEGWGGRALSGTLPFLKKLLIRYLWAKHSNPTYPSRVAQGPSV